MRVNYLLLSLLFANEVLASDNFNENKNFEVFVNSETMKVREKPFVESNILYSKIKDDKFIINGCNKFGWCELETGGYAPDFLLKAKGFKSNFKKEFTKHTNTIARVDSEKLNIYEVPFYKAQIIGEKRRNDLIQINGCDAYGWCELKDGGYIRSFLTQVEDKASKIEDSPKNLENKKQNISKEVKKDTIKIYKKKENPVIDKYKVALNYYKNKDFDNSYKLFKELFEDSLNDVNTNFYLGRSAFELKKYSEALGAYERVLFERPDAIRTKYEMARTFFIMNDLDNSKELFTQLKKEEKLKPKIKSNIEKYLIAIEEKTNRHIFNGAFIFGLSYDSNINNASDISTFDFYFDGVLYEDADYTTINDSDFSHEQALNLNYTYLMNDSSSISNNFLVFAKSMFTYDEKNTLFFSYNPSFNHIVNSKLQSSYGVFVDNLRLDNENYIISYGANPKFDYSLDSDNKLNLALKYQKKRYQQEANKNKNSTLYELKLANKHIYNPQNIISLEGYFTKDSNSIDKSESNKQFGLKLSDLYLYNQNMSFIPSISYSFTKYDNKNKNYQKKEDTKKLKLELINNYVYSKNIIIKTGAFFEDSKSNLPTSQYDKYGLNINLIRPF